ncbi:hypothetical protein PENFLA_c002G02577 [Penicillium flavigenum]|uniref:Uncharacterized protein n=1 Tax=Penicillium flavigenum TaxID=254877 RepID=A0A1V6TXF6_9EURO|nr:hypothetical protein PENFLA_c002G02577 [Penicillium flavigenum]
MKDSKSLPLSLALLEECDYPNSSSQAGTLTETQQELIDSIGNKQLASRLHKRTLKIFTREERLEAIEFYRTHVHNDPQTGEERNLSIASASETLHISECTLERWLESAIPVRIGFDYDEPFEGAPTHWAINLLLRTRAEILLPLSLCLRESTVNAIVTKAPQVSFSVSAVQPFQLVLLGHFSFVPQVSENAVLPQFSKHLEVSDTRPGKGLTLESIEEALKQDVHTTREREFRKKLVHALKLSVRKSLKYINDEKRCLYYTFLEPQEVPASYYCRRHSGSLINYVMNPVEPINLSAYREQEREINITDQTRDILKQLKILYERPEKTWILDFECYGELNTNGETSLQVKGQIIEVCGYSPDDIKILSWFAAQDMQCFLRILAGSNELVQDKISHKGHKNFQTINIGTLCGKLFPGLLSTTLQSVHEFLSGGEGSRGEYHTASYDTEAMAAIVKALLVQLT